MKKWIATFGLGVLLAASVHAASIEISPYGGLSIPVVQDDQTQGTVFGLRAPVKLIPLLTVEPYYAQGSLGDKSVDVAGLSYTREGYDETGYGANVLLTMGGPVSFYPFAGVGQSTLKRTGEDKSWTTYNAGLGLGLSPLPKLSVHVRGELQMAVDGQVSRKFANVTAGVSYALFSIP